MDIEFKRDDRVTPEEMQSLAEFVGFGSDRSLERNQVALDHSLFVGTARHQSRLIGLVRLVGDGAYILHIMDLIVHPDFQNKDVGRRLMEMAIEFAKDKKIGTGSNLGEFTLFANVGADAFYEKMGFTLAPNGMVLTDTESRKEYELRFQREWIEKRKEKR